MGNLVLFDFLAEQGYKMVILLRSCAPKVLTLQYHMINFLEWLRSALLDFVVFAVGVLLILGIWYILWCK